MMGVNMRITILIVAIIMCASCTETPIQYIEPEVIVEVDSLEQWDGFWVIPFPEGAKNLNVEISAFPGNEQFWSKCNNVLIDEVNCIIELYDNNRGYAGRYYRLTYYK
jgi:hypothetical protein